MKENLIQKNLGEGLELENSENHFCIFRDDVTGLEYIRNSKEVNRQWALYRTGRLQVQCLLKLPGSGRQRMASIFSLHMNTLTEGVCPT